LVFIYKSGAQVFTKLGIFIYKCHKEAYLCLSVNTHALERVRTRTHR